MKRVLRWRYYCDFCPKSGASGGHMKAHERSCCRNPERVCGMCEKAHLDQQPIAELIEALKSEDVKGLRETASGCPACMLAAIIQSGIQQPWNGEDDPGFRVEFDFKAESESFWADVHEEEATRGGGCS